MKSGESDERLKLVKPEMDRTPGFDSRNDDLLAHDLDWSILMARAQNGEAAAYLRLLEEITPYLRYRVSKYHRDTKDIEDSVQDVLLTVHAVRHTYDPTRPFAPWLIGIAKRRVFDRLRGQFRRQAHEVPLTDEHDAVPSVADDLESTADRVRLQGAINDLPPRQQQAIRLLKLKELTLIEASSESGMSIASLKVATHRALKTLRDMLSDRSES